MIELSTARDLIAIFGVIAGFSYYVLTVRNTNRARKTQVVMNLANMISSETKIQNYLYLQSMQWNDFDDFRNKYDSTTNPDHFAVRWNIWKLYDNIGYMLNQNIIDIDMVYYLVSGIHVVQCWKKFEPIINEQRILYNDPKWFRWWEYLYTEVNKFMEKNNITERILDEDIYKTEFKLPSH